MELGQEGRPGPEHALATGDVIGPAIVVADAEQHEVRAHARGSMPTDARHRGESVGEIPGVGMVVREAVDHAVRAILEGDHPGRREDPGLAHPATDHLAGAAGTIDEPRIADDEGADRAAEALRQAERRRGTGRQEVAGRDARARRTR